MKDELGKRQCRRCGFPVSLIDDDFFFDGFSKAYYCCKDPLCGNYNMVVEE
jgi:hypothetical protein